MPLRIRNFGSLASFICLFAVNGISCAATSFRPPLLDTEVIIRDTNNVTIADVDALNRRLKQYLAEVVTTPYFSTYKVDLTDRLCPFPDKNAVCGNRACAIETISEEEIKLPETWRSQYLGRLREDSVFENAPAGSCEDCAPEERSIYAYLGRSPNATAHDYCYPEDEDSAIGVWVDLHDNIERFTGYSGPHAESMWRAVYAENCFGYTGGDYVDAFGSSLAPAEIDASQVLASVMNFPVVVPSSAPVTVPVSQCVEQRLFYKLLSGMHASISTHLSYDYFNQTSGEWSPSLSEFMRRVGYHGDRLNYLYLDYVFLSRAVGKLQSYLGLLLFSPSCSELDATVRKQLWRLGRYINQFPRSINETDLFLTPDTVALKEEFRSRFRNVNALMSCVGCERCRLWGKIQTAGYGTALKILFELPDDPESDPKAVREVLSSFRRSELVALINTFARISHSVDAINDLREIYLDKTVDRTSWTYQWKWHMTETKRALKFILRSYIDFPKNIWNIILFYMNYYWNKFIGRPSVVIRYEL